MKHHQISRFFKPAPKKPAFHSPPPPAPEPVPSTPEPVPEPVPSPEPSANKDSKNVRKRKLPEESGHEPKVPKPKPTKQNPTKPKPTKLTPLEQEIVRFKQENQDKLMAVQVGYKYKFWGKDAEIVAKIINVMLLKHETDERFNYCSIPDNRLHVHLKRLLSMGYKVGVIKQTQSTMSKTFEPEGGKKGLFERKLTGVYTKATYMNEELELNSNNYGYSNYDHMNDNGDYMCCIKEQDLNIAIIVIKPLTGEIIVDSFKDNQLLQELDTRLTYFTPSEVILLGNDGQNGAITKLINVNNNNCRLETVDPSEDVLDELKQFFDQFTDEKYKSLYDYYKLNYDELTLMVLNELIKYLKPFQLSNIFTITSNIRNFKDNTTGDNMILASNIMRNLEIFQNSTNEDNKGSLFWLLNHTRTKIGERLLARWVSQPLVKKSKILDRLDAIDDLSNEFNHFIDSLSKTLNNDIDLEKSLIKLHYSTQNNPIKISRFEVYKLLKKFSEILTLVNNFTNDINKINDTFKSQELKSIFNELLKMADELDVESLLNMISINFFASKSTDKDVNQQKINYFNLNYHDWKPISNQLQKIEKINSEIAEESNEISKILGKPVRLIKNLNQDNLVEVRSTMTKKVPVDWIRINATKSITRFRSPNLQHLNNLLTYNQELLIKACDQCFQEFLNKINDKYWEFQKIVTSLAKFDCFLSLVTTKLNGVRPDFTDENSTIKIEGFKNPIQSYLQSNYITNDIMITPKQNRISIITGPNMGGKSSYIRSIGLLTIMAQIGCYLPCKSATISMFDNIFIRMGSVDNILKGQSTFFIEMLEMFQILHNFTDNSLILLDEIGSGTGTKDGYVMAYSILKYLLHHENNPVILFITHFHNIIEVVNEYKQTDLQHVINCFHMDYVLQDDQAVVFLYKLVEGIVDNSYGINVAKLSGIPEEVLQEASKISTKVKQQDQLNEILNIIHYIKQHDWSKALTKITDPKALDSM